MTQLRLVWPTDHKVYTQKFGQRPEFYNKFGLPGHEGVDLRAPNGTNIYACAEGVVVLAGWRKAGHPYGYSIRLRHKCSDGEYETIYAHLQEGSARVHVGEVVTAGQLIGLADSTGNSSAAHLHLSLKKIGAKNGGYGELIDPEPFLREAMKA
jgi:murein DD-endopeptidase MepM/ murein hydrolase activator NlpD